MKVLKINSFRPKLYVGGWYHFYQPIHHIPLTFGKIVTIDMFNIYLN